MNDKIRRKIRRIKQSRLTNNEILIISLLENLKVSSITNTHIYWEFDGEYMFKYIYKDAKLGISSNLKEYYSKDFPDLNELKNFFEIHVEEILKINPIEIIKFFKFDPIY
jgi:hypothetical protein